MKSNPSLLIILVLVALFPASTFAQTASPATYAVMRGDNLSLIAARFGVTIESVRRASGLRSDVLQPGQKLVIDEPFKRTKSKDIRWGRPVSRIGPVLREFGPFKDQGVLMPRTGTDLACPVGTRVKSPAHAVVRHIGVMEGFGTLIILEHGGGFATVMAPFDAATVEVVVGQAILRGAYLGKTGPPPVDEFEKPYVHLELRKKDKAVAPDRLYQ